MTLASREPGHVHELEGVLLRRDVLDSYRISAEDED